MRIRYRVGLALLGVAILLSVWRSVRAVLLSGRGKAICPHCGSTYISPSQTAARRDLLFRLVGCLPYRCRVCDQRFYRPRFST